MKGIKYKLPFVNSGKEFEIPNWTVEKHEKSIANALANTKDRKDLSNVQKENEVKYAIIYETLLEIDETVKIEFIREFFVHPDNLVEFFTAVYSAGKKDIYFHEALSKKPPIKRKKSISKKN